MLTLIVKKMVDKLIGDLHNLLSGDFSAEKEAIVAVLMTKIEDAWDQEEKYWEQRARVQWLKSSDRNTSFFFHASTLLRRRRNKILKLKKDDDHWLEKEEDIGNEFIEFYKKLFSSGDLDGLGDILDFVQHEITNEDNRCLMTADTDDENQVCSLSVGRYEGSWPG